MTNESDEIREFTREEFYEFVWSAPATKLELEVSCSNVMIGKICRSHDIPKPYPGYWAKLAHGKNPARPPLPKNEDPKIQSLKFYKSSPSERVVDEPPRETLYDPDIIELLDMAKRLGKVEVPESLRKPHRLITAAKNKINKAKADSKIPWDRREIVPRSELPVTVEISVSDQQSKRAYRIMNALVRRIEKLGGEVRPRKCGYRNQDSETVIILAGEFITRIRLREKHNQVRITNPEAKYRWDRNRTELVPSGLLLFDDGPSSFKSPLLRDKKNATIEDGLGEWIVKMIKEAGEIRIRKREQLELERQRKIQEEVQRKRQEEEQRRKQEEERLAKEEQDRIDYLNRLVDNWSRSKEIKDFIECAHEVMNERNLSSEGKHTNKQFLEWASRYANSLNPFRDMLERPKKGIPIKPK